MTTHQLQHRKAIAEWIGEEQYNYFITLRPKKTKLTEANTEKILMRAVEGIEFIERVFYVIESDYDRQSYHSHIAIKSTERLNRRGFAKAIKRHPSKEVIYFEKVKDHLGVGHYMSKYLHNEALVRGYGVLDREYDLYKQSETMYMHPNEKYQMRNKIMAQLGNGKALQGNSYIVGKSLC